MYKAHFYEIEGQRYLVNPLTGECQLVDDSDGKLVFLPSKKKHRPKFVPLELNALEELYKTDLTGTACCLLFCLLRHMDFAGMVYFKASYLARECNFSRSQFSHVAEELESRQMCVRMRSKESSAFCMLNPFLFFRGDLINRAGAIKCWREFQDIRYFELGIEPASKANREQPAAHLKAKQRVDEDISY